MKTPDPNTPPHKPQRAQPLQPDRPAGGDGRFEGDPGAAQEPRQDPQKQFSRNAKQLKKQVETGVANTREGYD